MEYVCKFIQFNSIHEIVNEISIYQHCDVIQRHYMILTCLNGNYNTSGKRLFKQTIKNEYIGVVFSGRTY